MNYKQKHKSIKRKSPNGNVGIKLEKLNANYKRFSKKTDTRTALFADKSTSNCFSHALYPFLSPYLKKTINTKWEILPTINRALAARWFQDVTLRSHSVVFESQLSVTVRSSIKCVYST